MGKIIQEKILSGFTLIEMIVVIGLFITLFAISTISLTNLIPKANFVTTHQSILSDIKSQQLKAMTGSTSGTGNGSAYGIFLENDKYTLFTGLTYSASSTDNYTIELSNGLSLTEITFPLNSIVFSQGNGEIPGFSELTSSFKLINSSTTEEYIFNLNKLGVVVPN